HGCKAAAPFAAAVVHQSVPMTTRILIFCLLFFVPGGIGALAAAPVITEMVASNQSGLKDDDGNRSDWIEIHNPGAAAVSLEGWYLTDKASDPRKWQFPATEIPAN